MPKCPHCGSSAQPKPFEEEWKEDGWIAKKLTWYRCWCGWGFLTDTVNECKDAEENIIDDCI